MNPYRLKTPITLGVNVLDLERMSHVRTRVVKTGDLRLDHPHTFGEGGDERFVELRCDPLVGAMLLDALRNEGRITKSVIARVYLRKGSGEWAKVPYNAVLSVPDGAGYTLNPDVFPVEIEPEPYDGGSGERVLFRKRK